MKHFRKYLSLTLYFIAQLFAKVSDAFDKLSLMAQPKN